MLATSTSSGGTTCSTVAGYTLRPKGEMFRGMQEEAGAKVLGWGLGRVSGRVGVQLSMMRFGRVSKGKRVVIAGNATTRCPTRSTFVLHGWQPLCRRYYRPPGQHLTRKS